jgi:hypothetical protein
MFAAAKARGDLSAAPIAESFLHAANRRRFLVAVIVAAAMALTWYTSQFYSLVFMQTALQFDFLNSGLLAGIAMVIGIPLFLGAGALSDRIGRKPVILAGMLLATVVVWPVYHGLQSVGHPAMARSVQSAPVVVYAAPTRFSPFSTAQPDEATQARDLLAKRGISYRNEPARPDAAVVVRVGDTELRGFDADAINAALAAAGYPGKASLPPISEFSGTHATLVALLVLLIASAALTCGPGAGFLAELFPTRIRYTSLSFPYHLTSAWFGGFMPLTATWLVARSGDIFAGLVYPIAVTATCFVLTLWLMPETHRDRMH